MEEGSSRRLGRDVPGDSGLRPGFPVAAAHYGRACALGKVRPVRERPAGNAATRHSASTYLSRRGVKFNPSAEGESLRGRPPPEMSYSRRTVFSGRSAPTPSVLNHTTEKARKDYLYFHGISERLFIVPYYSFEEVPTSFTEQGEKNALMPDSAERLATFLTAEAVRRLDAALSSGSP